MARYDDDLGPAPIIQLELIAIGLITVLTGIWWQICLFAKFDYPWISPMLLLTGLNIYTIYDQFPQAFSLRGLGLRIVTEFATVIFAFVILWFLYAIGVPIPDSAASGVMVPYSIAYVLGFTALYRFLIMCVWAILKVVQIA